MEYSLQSLNKSAHFKALTLKEIVENLNLIGFEVDEIFLQNSEVNSLSQNIKFLLKVPANREDLMVEELLIKEFNRLFSLNFFSNWKMLKKNYLSVLNNKYLEYEFFEIKSNLKDILVYNLEIENFTNFISPIWMQQKLKNNGIKIESDINDLINLISFEWGQTLQISFKNLNSCNLKIEQLKEEKTFITDSLSEKKITLPKNSIILKNEFNEFQCCIGYVDIVEKNISQKSTINIQIIFYDIIKNSLNINTLNTKLSTRYLRKTFIDFFKFSIQRFLTLLEILADETKFKIKVYKTNSKDITTNLTKIIKLKKKTFLNFLNHKEYNEEIFNKANLKIVTKTKDNLYFEISTNRKDLNREIDLIEEYTRFIGYKNFNQIIPLKNQSLINKKTNRYKFLKQFFINLGFSETIHSSLQENKKENNYSITLNNPLNNDFFLLRNELSSKIIETFENNKRLGFLNSKFFEIGRVFKNINGNVIEQERFVAIFNPFLNTNQELFSFDWYVNKGFIETLFTFFGYKKISFESIKIKNSVFHPTRSCLIKSNNIILGTFGEINPFLITNKETAFLIELNLSAFQDQQLLSEITFLKERSKYPSIVKDLSFIIKKEINFKELEESFKNITINLKDIYIFDIYFSNLVTNTINLGIRFEFQSEIQTLTNLEVEKEIKNIKDLLETKFEAVFTK